MKYLKTGQAAAMLGVSPRTIEHWVRHERIQYIKTPGGRNLIPETEVEKILTLNALKEEEQGHRDDIADIDKQIAEMEEKIKRLKGGK